MIVHWLIVECIPAIMALVLVSSDNAITQITANTNPTFFSLGWIGLDWTPWMPLSANAADYRRVIPAFPGFYRIRVPELRVLAYIGQTGRDLRERIRDLARNCYRNTPPWNDPHTAAPGLWAWRVEDGLEYEVSVTPQAMGLLAAPVPRRHALVRVPS